jgi:hypothetical protein
MDIAESALTAAISREKEANRNWSSAAKTWHSEKKVLRDQIFDLQFAHQKLYADNATLRALLKQRDGGVHSHYCKVRRRNDAECTCGHDAVVAYFKERGE